MKSCVHIKEPQTKQLQSHAENTQENQQERENSIFYEKSCCVFHFIENITVPNLSYISHHSKHKVFFFNVQFLPF